MVMESGRGEGFTGRGFQWDIIEVKAGPNAVKLGDDWDSSSDLLDKDELRDKVEEELARSSNFSLFSLISFMLSLEIWELTTFSSFFFSDSSLVFLTFKDEWSVFRFCSLSRVVSRLLFKSWISFLRHLSPFSRDFFFHSRPKSANIFIHDLYQ